MNDKKQKNGIIVMSKKELAVRDKEVDRLFGNVKSILDEARSKSYSAVNTTLMPILFLKFFLMIG